MTTLLKKIDIYGKQPLSWLNVDNEDKHQSALGGFFTILTGVLFVCLVFIQGKPIVQR